MRDEIDLAAIQFDAPVSEMQLRALVRLARAALRVLQDGKDVAPDEHAEFVISCEAFVDSEGGKFGRRSDK